MAASTTDVAETTERVTVRVLLFSLLREEVGHSELGVELDAPATGRTLLDCLAERYPAVAQHRPALRLAVNRDYCTADALLDEGDEVALITPVSGG